MKCFLLFILIFALYSLSGAQIDTLNSKKITEQKLLNQKSSDEVVHLIHRFSSPWGSSRSVGVDNYYASKIQGSTEVGNIMLLRGVFTSNRHAFRVTLPVISSATPNGYESGLGNINLLDEIRITGDSANVHFGMGPLVSIPTRTSPSLGVDYWQFGISAVTVHATQSGIIMGALMTYRNSINDFSDRGGYLTIQPAFVLYLGSGFYARSLGATMVFDFINHKTLVPLGLGIGKIFKMGDKLGNLFIEPGYTVYSKGKNLPAEELLVGLNIIWIGKKKGN